MKKEFIDKINDADLILIGIGKEFEINKYQCEKRAIDALVELKNHLEGKNYYMITICTNSILKCAGLSEERMVSPCGNLELKQCSNQCDGSLQELTEDDLYRLEECIKSGNEPIFGKCPLCGGEMVLNNIYAASYDENGYLENWKLYTKWLQGTLNKKLYVLELGTDLSFPTIIRWPFEKVAYFNQKAEFFRVNAELYHMTEELKDKGVAIAQNSIDWLLEKDI